MNATASLPVLRIEHFLTTTCEIYNSNAPKTGEHLYRSEWRNSNLDNNGDCLTSSALLTLGQMLLVCQVSYTDHTHTHASIGFSLPHIGNRMIVRLFPTTGYQGQSKLNSAMAPPRSHSSFCTSRHDCRRATTDCSCTWHPLLSSNAT
jgi:hypothetical protein